MGSKANTFITNLLNTLFNNSALANIGNAGGIQPSSVAGSLYVALHTADPGVGGSQNTTEAAYTGYARVAVARSSGGWTITAQSVSPTATIVFPAGTAGGETCTYASIGTLVSGAGMILYRGTLTPNIVTGNGITPEIPVSSTITES